jgi:hypothetical protein
MTKFGVGKDGFGEAMRGDIEGAKDMRQSKYQIGSCEPPKDDGDR